MRAAPHDQRLVAARRAAAAGDADGAFRVLRSILALDPDDVEALRVYASVCFMATLHAEGVGALRRAVAVAPDNPLLLCDLAVAVEQEGRHDEADGLLQRACRIAPDDARVLTTRAEWLLTAGRAAEAERLLAPRAADSDARIALTWALVCDRQGRPADGVEALRPHANDPRITPLARRAILFRLANLLDACARFDEAFHAARAANELAGARGRAPFDPAIHRRSIDLLIERWTPDALARLPVGDASTRRPVFIVGVPRSGTSLVEQILASHPDVFGADERPEITMVVERLQGAALPTAVPHMHRLEAMTPDMTARAAAAYLEVMQGLHASAARVTDKRPDNFLHLGLISRLFPGAKVIHITRNPLDVAVSCFLRDFYGPYPWSGALDHIADYIADERRLMAHWRSALDLDILSLRYEDLVDAPGIETHRLVHHIDLPWSDACLRFHESGRIVRTSSVEQVRRPVHQGAVERWRNYEDHLGALLERFPDADAGDIRAA